MLTSYEKDSNRYEYSYNEDGLRVEKKYYSNNTLNDICTYVWENGKLIAQKKYSCANNDYLTITYLYDGEEAIGFVYDGLTFYYIKNIQGDVTAIAMANNGKLALIVSYDAWGNPTYSVVTYDDAAWQENLAATLKAFAVMGVNNYTYRGYFYDTETGLYYLQSRYYDPEVGRFVNLDDASIAIITSSDILSCNLFAYCNNNPIVASDHTGLMGKDALNALAKGYYLKRDSYRLATSCLTSNTKNVYTAFHEIAQVIIGSTLFDKGYLVELEKNVMLGILMFTEVRIIINIFGRLNLSEVKVRKVN